MLPKLPCDEKITLQMPYNGISERGQEEIIAYLGRQPAVLDVVPWEEALARSVHSHCWLADRGSTPPANYEGVEFLLNSAGWEWAWKTTRGTLPKRVGSLFHKLGAKLPTDALEQVGNLASSSTERCVEHVLDFTQHFDWRDGDFGDGGSCFWGGRSGAREMLRGLGAYALRFYSPEHGEGSARSWLVPCIDCGREFFMLFNAYSCGEYNYDALAQARILAFFLGVSYRKCPDLRNNGGTDGVLYINSGMGFAVGATEHVGNVTQWDFHCDEVYCSEYTCVGCGEDLDEDAVVYRADGDDDTYCSGCFYERYLSCDRCGGHVWREGGEYTTLADSGEVWCDSCAGGYAYCCYSCAESYRNSRHGSLGPDDCWYCDSCYREKFSRCEGCEAAFVTEDLTCAPNDRRYCSDCYSERWRECKECGERKEYHGCAWVVCPDCRAEEVERLERGAGQTAISFAV